MLDEIWVHVLRLTYTGLLLGTVLAGYIGPPAVLIYAVVRGRRMLRGGIGSRPRLVIEVVLATAIFIVAAGFWQRAVLWSIEPMPGNRPGIADGDLGDGSTFINVSAGISEFLPDGRIVQHQLETHERLEVTFTIREPGPFSEPPRLVHTWTVEDCGDETQGSTSTLLDLRLLVGLDEHCTVHLQYGNLQYGPYTVP